MGSLFRRLNVGIFGFFWFCGVAAADTPARPLTVVELYTSQSCGYCPDAEVFLQDLSDQRPDVLALQFHIDYWDYMGWRDTLARPENAERQKAYKRNLQNRRVYTPQMVIHGAYEVSGDRPEKALAQINAVEPRADIALKAQRAGDEVVVTLGQADLPQDAVIWFVPYMENPKPVAIKRGDNRGRTLKSSNVVKGIRRVGAWSGDAGVMRVSLTEDERGLACAVIAQTPGMGPVIAAARCEDSSAM